MGISRTILLWCSERRWLGEQAEKRQFTRKTVLRFMPGEDVDKAMRAAATLREHGIATILHELGENVTSSGEANLATDHYREALDRIADSDLDAQISTKLTHLGLDVDADLTYRNLARLLEHASETKSFVWVDMEGSAYTDRTLELFRRVRREFSCVGICLQSYLYRASKDLEDLLALGPTIRLVKGAYKEPESLAFPRKKEVDENFFKLAKRLLEDDARQAGARLAVATHDLKLIERITSHAKTSHLELDVFEIQMLYGIQRQAQIDLARAGHSLRVLISYGTDWYPWFVRRLAERPANVWFLLRNFF